MLLCVCAACAACKGGLKRMAVDQTASVLKSALPAFEREWDYELAESAFPASIKTVEGFLVSAPDNQDLLLMLARSYTAYASVVVEDRLERARAATEDFESPQIQLQRLRAREMYLRGHRYGLQLLELRHPGFREAFKLGREKLSAALADCDEDDVAPLFWMAMPLASAINVARDDVTLIGQLSKVRSTMERLVELDETYYHAGPHLVLGALLGGVGRAVGGRPEIAKKHFERALSLTKRKFLLVQETYARTVAVTLQDQKLFKSLLTEVLKTDLASYPEQMLANVAAKRRARRTLARADELF